MNECTIEYCTFCKKRLKLINFSCSCKGVFCNKHRFPETHDCSFNFIEKAKEKLNKNNPIIKPDKITAF